MASRSCRGILLSCVCLPLAAQALPSPAELPAALHALPLQPPTADGAVVLVVDDAGKPVAGADLFVVDRERMQAARERLMGPTSAEMDLWTGVQAMLFFGARRLQTGADGSVRAGDVGMGAVAVHGDRVGVLVEREAAPLRIVLRPVLACTATVVDSQGKVVAGIALGLAAAKEQVQLSPLQPMGRTGDDGALRWRLPRALLDGNPLRDHLQVRADLPGPPVMAPFVIDANEPKAAARVQLPPTGQVRVIVYDAAEQPLRGVHDVQLRQKLSADAILDEQSAWQPTRSEPTGATFAWVQLGLALSATAKLEGVAGELRLERQGPMRAGELVVFDLRTTVGAPLLQARMLGLDGAPVADEPLQVLLMAPRDTRPVEARSDADGRLCIAVPADFPLREPARALVMRHGRGSPTAYGGAAWLTIPAGAHGPVDLGDVQLLAEPLRAEGVVVDRSGKPLAGIELEVPLSHFARADLRVQQASFPHRIRTGADGRFAIHELQPANEAAVLRPPPRSELHILEQGPVRLGVADLRVVVAGGGSLRLSLPGAPREGVLALLWRHGDYPSFCQLDDGTYVYENLTPGFYEVHLQVGGEVVAKIDRVDVRAGEPCADPRLADIPWRQYVRVVRLRVRDAQGRPLQPDIQVAVPGEGSLGAAMFTCWPDGIAEFALRKDAVGPMVVRHDEYLSQEFATFGDQLEVTMQPRPRVRIRLPDGLQLPAGASVQLRPAVPQRQEFARIVHEPARRADPSLFRPEAVGKHVVLLTCEPDRDAAAVWRGEIDVQPGDAVQEFELKVDRAVIDRLREAVQARLPAKEPGQGR